MRIASFMVLMGCGAAAPRAHHAIQHCSTPPASATASGSGGHWFDAARVRDLVPGDSTLDDARCALGEPFSATANGDGTTAVNWYYINVTTGATASEQVLILFGADQRMIRVLGATSTK